MRRVIVLILFVLVGSTAHAEPQESHRAAAVRLLRLMDMEKQMLGGASAMADAIVSQNPMMAPYRDVVMSWSAKFMTWDNLQDEFSLIYSEAYSEAELNQLVEFYQTPVGKKTIELGPSLMKLGAEVGAKEAAQHAPELEAMIRERSAELQRLAPPAQE